MRKQNLEAHGLLVKVVESSAIIPSSQLTERTSWLLRVAQCSQSRLLNTLTNAGRSDCTLRSNVNSSSWRCQEGFAVWRDGVMEQVPGLGESAEHDRPGGPWGRKLRSAKSTQQWRCGLEPVVAAACV
ncbi:hypothetical protein MPTK1_7g16090 [Marchantia polymorpha subsp. ruderalis]|uniref:Uncharacterized protein n=2 Tax=Marchantia polymorpha TaxID=3197 RepID=A0AAF6C070_MARPO|nr:hypothetical protein MARPO_0111s0011 [Marchantia polymorpha]BBN17654.1 hypothetical protein Mp_7g16090 [Marchantia polymorpha subsp. ruderalis]|eukprot:PTQ31450.1 hypothetical protein MARPO_0111s0011 [Marchantia polymorpha]